MVSYGIEIALYKGPKSGVTSQESDYLNEFKVKIKTWCPGDCPYKLCKRYIFHVSYV